MERMSNNNSQQIVPSNEVPSWLSVGSSYKSKFEMVVASDSGRGPSIAEPGAATLPSTQMVTDDDRLRHTKRRTYHVDHMDDNRPSKFIKVDDKIDKKIKKDKKVSKNDRKARGEREGSARKEKKPKKRMKQREKKRGKVTWKNEEGLAPLSEFVASAAENASDSWDSSSAEEVESSNALTDEYQQQHQRGSKHKQQQQLVLADPNMEIRYLPNGDMITVRKKPTLGDVGIMTSNRDSNGNVGGGGKEEIIAWREGERSKEYYDEVVWNIEYRADRDILLYEGLHPSDVSKYEVFVGKSSACPSEPLMRTASSFNRGVRGGTLPSGMLVAIAQSKKHLHEATTSSVSKVDQIFQQRYQLRNTRQREFEIKMNRSRRYFAPTHKFSIEDPTVARLAFISASPAPAGVSTQNRYHGEFSSQVASHAGAASGTSVSLILPFSFMDPDVARELGIWLSTAVDGTETAAVASTAAVAAAANTEQHRLRPESETIHPHQQQQQLQSEATRAAEELLSITRVINQELRLHPLDLTSIVSAAAAQGELSRLQLLASGQTVNSLRAGQASRNGASMAGRAGSNVALSIAALGLAGTDKKISLLRDGIETARRYLESGGVSGAEDEVEDEDEDEMASSKNSTLEIFHKQTKHQQRQQWQLRVVMRCSLPVLHAVTLNLHQHHGTYYKVLDSFAAAQRDCPLGLQTRFARYLFERTNFNTASYKTQLESMGLISRQVLEQAKNVLTARALNASFATVTAAAAASSLSPLALFSKEANALDSVSAFTAAAAAGERVPPRLQYDIDAARIEVCYRWIMQERAYGFTERAVALVQVSD